MDKLKATRDEIDRIDKQMSELFVRRMEAVKNVAEYKFQSGMKVFDPEREKELIDGLLSDTQCDIPTKSCKDFFQSALNISKAYQHKLICELKNENNKNCTSLYADMGDHGYEINIGCGLIESADKYFDLDRRVLIVTDSNIPSEYVNKLSSLCAYPHCLTLPAGEASKNKDNLDLILSKLECEGFGRRDCVVALGGGVVGDISCLASSIYMRGIDFYNIPTTVLSAVDASVGGKCAIDYNGIKNSVGSFYDPRSVLIDPRLFDTLDKRQFSNGLAEALKTAILFDPELLSIFEEGAYYEKIDRVIELSLRAKLAVVEADPKENGLRRVLNFGHTFAHGIESATGFGTLLHGECVALGMLPMCSEDVRQKLIPIYERLGLRATYEFDIDKVLNFALHDKKTENGVIHEIFCHKYGYSFEDMTVERWKSHISKYFGSEDNT